MLACAGRGDGRRYSALRARLGHRPRAGVARVRADGARPGGGAPRPGGLQRGRRQPVHRPGRGGARGRAAPAAQLAAPPRYLLPTRGAPLTLGFQRAPGCQVSPRSLATAGQFSSRRFWTKPRNYVWKRFAVTELCRNPRDLCAGHPRARCLKRKPKPKRLDLKRESHVNRSTLSLGESRHSATWSRDPHTRRVRRVRRR